MRFVQIISQGGTLVYFGLASFHKDPQVVLVSLSWIVVVVVVISSLRAWGCKNSKKCQSATIFCCTVVCWSECGSEEGGFCYYGKNDPLPQYSITPPIRNSFFKAWFPINGEKR